jgi:hypothetical protein
MEVIGVCGHGYIHPDEVFQGPEPVFHVIFRDSQTPRVWAWEFTTQHPIRAILPILLSSGIPLLIVKAFSGILSLAWVRFLLYLFPRLHMALLARVLRAFDFWFLISDPLSRKYAWKRGEETQFGQ